MSSLKPREIITGFPDRQSFFKIIANEHPGIVVKFTASWCKPCKIIDPIVKPFFTKNSNKILCCYLDIDENYDIYSFMKHKKMANGVPTLMYYAKGNHNYIPDASISGANLKQVEHFFSQVNL